MERVKRCPACGSSQNDAEDYCPVDGVRLEGEGERSTPLLPEGCPSCGAALVGQDDRCLACGQRLGSRGRQGGEAARIGPYLVLRPLDHERLLVCSTEGSVRQLVFGAQDALEREQQAAALLGAPPSPRPGARGSDAARGAYLELDIPPPAAERLREVAPKLGVSELRAILAVLLGVSEQLEQQGLRWQPAPEDLLWEPGAGLWLSRLRGVARLAPGARADTRGLLHAAGAALSPWPAARGPVELVRGLLPGRHTSEGPAWSVADARQWLRCAEEPAAGRSSLAAMSDVGLWRLHNQDAVAVAEGQAGGDRWSVLVVCDGVSSSPASDRAAQIVARVVCDELTRAAEGPAPGRAEAVGAALREAHRRLCDESWGDVAAPGTTAVAALRVGRHLSVGWSGDSRAYWVSHGEVRTLTRDHSWVNEVVDRGDMSEEEAIASPNAHTITRCLGPLEGEQTRPDVRSCELPGPGALVLCTDGLWNYTPTPASLGEVVRRSAPGAEAISRTLINFALARGGLDNVSVAVCCVD